MNIRENVKKLCRLQRMTQKQLAERIGITDSNLNIAIGREDPRLSTVKRIADALGVGVDALISENLEEHLAAAIPDNQERRAPQQGLYCPHCGKSLTLFVRAEDTDASASQ